MNTRMTCPLGEFRNRLLEWYIRGAETIVAMSPEQVARLDAWRDLHPEQSDADWPELIALIGPRPKPTHLIVLPRRTA